MRRTLALALIAAALGCGPARGDAFLASFAAGQRAYHAGRYEEAAGLFAAAAGEAERIKDRDEALFLTARMHERARRWDDARRTYRELIAGSPRGPRTARASFELADLEVTHGDADTGWRLLEEAVQRYPGHGATRGAVSRLCDHLREDGEEALRARLASWRPAAGETELAQRIDYEIAQSLERSGDLAGAHALLVSTARAHPYPRGNLTDDVWWRASLVAEAQGDYPQAIADLLELLSAREVATGGSYERPRFPSAQMRVAELYRDRLDDVAAARREFRMVYTRHESSVLADDAMWQDAILAERQGERDEACRIGLALPERFPDSRYTRCVRLVCPGAPEADRECPRYIREAGAAPGDGASM